MSAMTSLGGERYARTRQHLEGVRKVAAARFDHGGLETAERAIEWALACHIGQRDRPDGTPYVEHVTSVAARVLGWAAAPSPELCATALLHDSLEDQEAVLAARGPGTGDDATRARAAIEQAFGPRVRSMLESLTNPDFKRDACEQHGCAPGSPAQDAVQLALYTVHFVEIFNGDRETGLIKLADFTDNALRLDGLKAHKPEQYRWLARKYGPCVAFLIDELEALSDPADPLFCVAESTLGALRQAWVRYYAPGGSQAR